MAWQCNASEQSPQLAAVTVHRMRCTSCSLEDRPLRLGQQHAVHTLHTLPLRQLSAIMRSAASTNAMRLQEHELALNR